jgi:hypothetical protein
MATQVAGPTLALNAVSQRITAGKLPGNPDAGAYAGVLIAGIIAVTSASVLVLLLGQPISTTSTGAAAGVLAISTSLAVGIERVLEGFWTLMDQWSTRPSWPFASEAKQLEDFANQFNAYLAPSLESARSLLATLQQVAPSEYKRLKGDVETLKAAVDAVASAQDPGTLPAALAAAQASLRSLTIQIQNPAVRQQVQLASAGVLAIAQLADSLATNPGRKILSLFAGALLGLLAAAVLGLDLIHAALGVPGPATLGLRDGLSGWWNAGPSAWPWAMVATGLVIGLGSNPTHEVIQAIQNYKQQKSASP